MGSKFKILLVEDEQAIFAGLIDVLVFHGYEVAHTADGLKGLELAKNGGFDLILLDVMLPNMDGFSICNAIRQGDRVTPIIMLTAKTSEEDIIKGLSYGADDYVGKPFSLRELLLRIEAILRRTDKAKRMIDVIGLGNWEIHIPALLAKHTVNATEQELTKREVEIIVYLASVGDRPVSREELLEKVWDYSKTAVIETRTVDIHLAKLRRKLEKDPKNPELLITVRGAGYALGNMRKARQ